MGEVRQTTQARGQAHLVRLDPTLGSEIQKTRPCLVVSPDELNEYLRTVIVAPTTSGPTRGESPAGFSAGLAVWLALDQLRTVATERLVRPLGRLTPQLVTTVLRRLQEMFAE